jgi:hypothetical protein
MVHCLIVPCTDAHGTLHDTDPSQMTPEARMICHHPVYHPRPKHVSQKGKNQEPANPANTNRTKMAHRTQGRNWKITNHNKNEESGTL